MEILKTIVEQKQKEKSQILLINKTTSITKMNTKEETRDNQKKLTEASPYILIIASNKNYFKWTDLKT